VFSFFRNRKLWPSTFALMKSADLEMGTIQVAESNQNDFVGFLCEHGPERYGIPAEILEDWFNALNKEFAHLQALRGKGRYD